VFTHRDHISTIRRTVNTIWNHWLPASGLKAADAPNFERYDEKVRSAHRQWRARNLDTGEGLMRSGQPVRVKKARKWSCPRAGFAWRRPLIAWQAISTLP
jgi:hypothetical protein